MDTTNTSVTATERYKLNKELAQMLKGGVIMDVTTPEQVVILGVSGGAGKYMTGFKTVAAMVNNGGVSRMSDPKMIRGIQEAVSIPVMAKCRIGLFLLRRRYLRQSTSTTLMKARFFHRLMMYAI